MERSNCPIPPKPKSRPEKLSLFRRIRLARKNIFSAQPERLYGAWMAELKTPFYTSFFINQPALVETILVGRPQDFPKSPIVQKTLAALLGQSVFVTNGSLWQSQRRIIDPAFEGGRLRDVFPAMVAAGDEALTRLGNGGTIEMEAQSTHLAADVIFRTLFSTPISDVEAAAVYRDFQTYQRSQPLMTWPDLLRMPAWVPRYRPRRARVAASAIRARLRAMILLRASQIASHAAPQDLATKIMTTPDPQTGKCFSEGEMVDQVAIFFLAGHETSASALSWALYLLALDQGVQNRLFSEVQRVLGRQKPGFSDIGKLAFCRDIFRETLRLYPPVPMMVRETTKTEVFRDRPAETGSLCIISPWHMQRHQRIWADPDAFDPDRWGREENRACMRDAYLPFSKGPRVCPGAGFAMIEGVLMLAMLVRAFKFETIPEKAPVPVTHLTVRSENGIWLRLTRR